MVTISTGDGQPPRTLLGSWPTPLEPMPRLARALGLGADDLWVKRDDLVGLGGGGNKVRKLEWTCGAAPADTAEHFTQERASATALGLIRGPDAVRTVWEDAAAAPAPAGPGGPGQRWVRTPAR